MSYALKRKESPGDGMRRVVGGELGKTIGDLAPAAGTTQDQAVHSARQRIKKLRAALRLVRGRLGDKLFQEENDALGETGRALSDLRDAKVELDALDELLKFYHLAPAQFSLIRQRLRRKHEGLANSSNSGSPLGLALRRLGEIEERAGAWPLEKVAWNDVREGFRQSYRKGRKALRSAARSEQVQPWHEWRKRVKDLRYQAELLRKVGSKQIKKMEKAARTLGDHLGKNHDLILLSRDVQKGPGRRKNSGAPVLTEVIQRRRLELENCALRLGQRLYRPKPRQVARLLERR